MQHKETFLQPRFRTVRKTRTRDSLIKLSLHLRHLESWLLTLEEVQTLYYCSHMEPEPSHPALLVMSGPSVGKFFPTLATLKFGKVTALLDIYT